MKCKSCNEDVDVKMKKALEQNKCPYCGNAILDTETMKQFLDLREVLEPITLTDSEWHDKKIKENVIKILMEQMVCTRKKVVINKDIVKLNEKPPTEKEETTPLPPPITSSVTSVDHEKIDEQRRMRAEIYNQLQEEQYGEKPEEVNEDDVDAARGVVFTEMTDERVERLKPLAPPRRISRVTD